MPRLKDITKEELEKWRKARLEHGQKKYGDSDLDRDNDVDMVEEVLDIVNIAERKCNRLSEQGELDPDNQRAYIHKKYYNMVVDTAERLVNIIQEWDKKTPDRCATDGKGGDRIYWPPEE